MGDGRELSKEHPTPAEERPLPQEGAPFPGWCCLSPHLHPSFSFLCSGVMPLLQIRKLFQSKQLFSRSRFNT